MLMNGKPSALRRAIQPSDPIGFADWLHHACRVRGAIVAGCTLVSAVAAPASNANTVTAPAPLWQKPAWLTDFGVGIKESYDNNVLMVVERGVTMPLQSSWITTVSPKLGFDFAPLVGHPETWQKLALVYAPEVGTYHDADAENYAAHKITNSIAARSGDFSFSVDNGFQFIDGNRSGPTFQLPSGKKEDYSVLAVSAVRERRLQVQDALGVTLRYDAGKFFIRPAASLLYYDLMTDWHNGGMGSGPSLPGYVGYINYVDRTDANGGLDAGLKVAANLAATVGYRYGHQYQQSLPAEINSLAVNGQQAQSSSDYQRLLLGLEGRPWEWLTVNLRAGPDFREYNLAAPVDDRRPVTYYSEGAVTAAVTANQSLSFSCKHWQWESSIGRLPYVENIYMLAYHWNPVRQLGFDVSGRFANQDYTCGSSKLSNGASLRNDAMYTFALGTTYLFTPNLSASLGYAYDLGRNLQDNGSAGDYRQFNHEVVSLGVKFRF